MDATIAKAAKFLKENAPEGNWAFKVWPDGNMEIILYKQIGSIGGYEGHPAYTEEEWRLVGNSPCVTEYRYHSRYPVPLPECPGPPGTLGKDDTSVPKSTLEAE